MKKLLTILAMALALCMLCGFALAVEDTEFEDYGDAVARIHDFAPDGDHEIVATAHKDATCKEAGWVMFKCVKHGDWVHTYPLKKLDHKLVLDETTYKPATCTQDGYEKWTCSECGEIIVLTPAAKGHVMSKDVDGEQWGIILPGNEPKCYQEGIAFNYCVAEWHDETVDNDLGPSGNERYDENDNRWIDRLPHDFSGKDYQTWGDWVPTCLNGLAMRYQKYCTMCGGYERNPDEYWPDFDAEEWNYYDGKLSEYKAQDTTWATTHDDNGHEWDSWAEFVPADAADPCSSSFDIRSCGLCAEKQVRENKVAPKYNANPDEQWLESCYKQRNTWLCTKCGGKHEGHTKVEYEEVVAHDWETIEFTPATCVNEGYEKQRCKHADDPDHEGDETAEREWTWIEDHVFGEWAEISAPSAGHNGLYTRSCIYCGKVQEYRTDKTLADLQSSTDYDKVEWKLYDETDPSCEEWGGKRFYVGADWDSRTDERWFPTEAPLGHDWVEVTVEATCTADGLTSRVCNRCGATEAEVLPATGHTVKVEEGKAPTCGEDGLTDKEYCEVCGEVFVEAEVIPATGAHDWKHYDAKAATCTEAGYTEYVECTVCYQQMVKKTEIPAAGHTWSDWTVTKAADCHNDGEEERECTVCGEKETKVIAAEEAHEWTEWVETKAATCTEDGEEERECTKCGDKEVNVIKAAHTYGEKVVAVAPTCTAAGLQTETCTVCGYINAVAIPATGHTEKVEEGFAPTCGVDGLTDKVYCEVCGEVLVEAKAIPATGAHDYQPVMGKAATCTEDGLTNGVSCTVCGKVLLAPSVIPAKGHDIVKLDAVAATCTTDGKTAGQYCKNCDEETIEQEVIKALGHAWDEGVVTKEAEPGVAGEKVYTCSVCGETETEVIAPLPIPADYKLVDVKFEGTMLTGKIEHVDGTEVAEKLGVRVTFFIEGNVYMTTAATIYEDGTFEAEGAGVIEHVTVAAYATNKVVNPQGLKDVTCFGSEEFDVK